MIILDELKPILEELINDPNTSADAIEKIMAIDHDVDTSEVDGLRAERDALIAERDGIAAERDAYWSQKVKDMFFGKSEEAPEEEKSEEEPEKTYTFDELIYGKEED